LPNRLFLQNDDGTLRDATVESGADWLDSCASALLIDIDNDGHQDLLVATAWYLLLMKNDGVGHFELKSAVESQGQLFSLAAADYDADGDLDVYACGYHGTADRMRSGGAMATPMPFHDANNGAPNMLMRNDGNWKFSNQTKSVGLDVNNTRFSYAASWEDYDNDGDVDLYVANDFGRNNLFRNDDGQFADIAASSGVEDMAAGMSVDWADIDQDGLMDLYISNMFSSAGNRITYQPQFKTETGDDVRSQFQRHARGNTLFRNAGDDRFDDISVDAGVTMGRWAWGSKFVDFNNDGREDIVVANGFITSTDTGDL
jgi:hypothetical protein